MSKAMELGSIADLPLEERHAIVVSWLNTLTTFYERACAIRDAALKACEAIEDSPCRYDHHGYCQAHGLQPKGECYVELARAAPTKAGKP